MVVIPACIYFITIIIGILRRNSRLVRLWILLFIWILIGMNTYSPDYSSYEAVYNGTYYGLNMDVGFKMCCAFFSFIGLSYQQFRMMWALIYVLLLNNFISKNTKSPNFVLALTLICPVLLDVSGIRSCVAYLIALNFSILLKKPSLKRKIIYVLGVLLAATFHITAVFFLVFLLMGVNSKKRILFIATGVSAATIAVYTPILNKFASMLYEITGIYAIQKWLLGGSANTHPNIIGISSVAVFLIAYVWVLLKEARALAKHGIEEYEMRQCVMFLKSIGTFELFLLPLLMISTESRRLLFGVLIVYYCMTGNIFTFNDKSLVYTRTTFKFMVMEILISVGVLWMYMYSYQSHNVMAVLYDNLVLGFGLGR